ncbi:MAG: TolC family protein [Lentisphaerae bacterium]|nr:TolC family protein [Lentisphaerota bacterium]
MATTGSPSTYLDAPALSVPDLPTAPLTLEQAIARAIAYSSQISLLRAAEDLALQERRAATDLDDPEFTAAWSDASSDDVQQDWGSQQSTTTTRGRDSSTETQRDTSLVPGESSSVRRTTGQETSKSTSRQYSTDYTSGTSSSDEDAYRLGLRFFVPNPFLLGPRVSARKAQMQAAQSDRLDAERQIANDVHRLFLEVDYQTNDLALASTSVALHDIILKTVRSRAEATGATGADVLKATQGRMQAATQRDRTRLAGAAALRELADLLNVPARALRLDTTTATDIPLNMTLASPDEIEAIALRTREDLMALYWRMRAAEQAYREIRNAGIPWFSHIDASYGEGHQTSSGYETSSGSGTGSSSGSQSSSASGDIRNVGPGGESSPTSVRNEARETSESSTSRRIESGTSTSSDDEDSTEWQVGFMVTVPIFTWFVNHEDDVALAEYKLASAQYAEQARLVSRHIQNAYDEWVEAQREWNTYAATEGPFLSQVRQALKSLEGTIDLTPDEIASVKLEIVNSLRLWREARLNYRKTVLDLERAAGVPIRDLVRPAAAPAADPAPATPSAP